MTDFSIGADHAAFYALKLARQIKANVLICNVFLAASYESTTAQLGLPLDDYKIYEDGSIADLGELTARLNKQLKTDSAEGDFKPSIRYCCKSGPIADAINDIALSNHVLMAVIGMHHEGGLSSLLLGNHTSEIIENANCPVLVVPYETPFTGLKKIAFATNLKEPGIEVLRCITGLAKHSEAEILITHVADDKSTLQDDQQVVSRFFDQVSAHIKYHKIYFKAIKSNSVTTGLDWLTEHTDIDMLVLIHQKRNFLQRIFERSVTKKMAGRLVKPMLVFPSMEILEALPVF